MSYDFDQMENDNNYLSYVDCMNDYEECDFDEGYDYEKVMLKEK